MFDRLLVPLLPPSGGKQREWTASQPFRSILLACSLLWKEGNGKEEIAMPMYEYRCPECGVEESRVAGVDDRTVVCTGCSNIMYRLTSDDDLFEAYWDKPSRSSKATGAA